MCPSTRSVSYTHLCNGGMDANLTIIALAYIEIELQHHPCLLYTSPCVTELSDNRVSDGSGIRFGKCPPKRLSGYLNTALRGIVLLSCQGA